MIKRRGFRGEVVHSALLPSVPVDSDRGFKYDCNKHVMHSDKQGVLLIDPGHLFRGNLSACVEDMRSSMIRLLNHDGNPNAELYIKEDCKPQWYEPVDDDHGVETWYTCSIVLLKDVGAREELTIKYAHVPGSW